MTDIAISLRTLAGNSTPPLSKTGKVSPHPVLTSTPPASPDALEAARVAAVLHALDRSQISVSILAKHLAESHAGRDAVVQYFRSGGTYGGRVVVKPGRIAGSLVVSLP